MTDNDDTKAILVLTQEEIDTTIDAIEQAGVRMHPDEFQEQYGDVYRKLHAVENEDGDNEYHVK